VGVGSCPFLEIAFGLGWVLDLVQRCCESDYAVVRGVYQQAHQSLASRQGRVSGTLRSGD
jgi:hypothetical protein